MNEPEFYSDALSDVLEYLNVEDVVLTHTQVRRTGGLTFPQGLSGAMVHMVKRGAMEVHDEDGQVIHVAPGAVVLIPRASDHKVGTPGVKRFSPLEQETSVRTPSGAKYLDVGRGEAHSEVFSAYFTFRFQDTNPMLELLTGVVVVTEEERDGDLDAILRMLELEMTRPRPGLRAMSGRLVELLFVWTLRVYIGRLEGTRPGLMGGLADARLARAIGAMSGEARRDWTLDELARIAGMSRSRFATVFKQRVGMTPFECLAHWRVLHAQRLLMDRDLGLMEVAEQVGYGSDVALSRAFKRVTGSPPGAWRAAQRARIERLEAVA